MYSSSPNGLVSLFRISHGRGFSSTDTATILEDVFAAGADHYELSNTERVLKQLEPIDEWTQIVPGLRVHPVPAGHTRGAAGFLFEVTADDKRRTILVTGDFTTRRAAGYPGFDLDLPVDVDVLVLTAATSEDSEATLTEDAQRTTTSATRRIQS